MSVFEHSGKYELTYSHLLCCLVAQSVSIGLKADSPGSKVFLCWQ